MRRILPFIFIAIFGIANAQSLTYQWAKSATGTNNDEGNSIATDLKGNSYVIGRFSSPSIAFGSITLTNAGAYDFFIAKYDADGNVLWAKSAGGTADEVGQSIATDTNGNVVVTGYFYSPSISFGATTLINSSPADDAFIVKYDSSGNVLWAKSVGGGGYEDGSGIATDAEGNIFVAGHFSSPSISFGTTTLTNTTSPAGEIFLVKYDPNGNELWAQLGGQSPLTERASSVASDANGNVYITGYFYDASVRFGTIDLIKTSTNESDLYIVKYDANGNALWAKNEGGTGNDFGRSLSTDANGNVFVTGYFKSPSITFGTTTIMNVGTSTASLNLFVVKYDSTGNILWAKGAGDNKAEIAYCITTDNEGSAYVAGSFSSSSIAFDNDTITKTGSTTNYTDIFVVKYDSSGNAVWAKGVGGTDNETAYGIATDANGNVLLTGDFYSSSITFGATTLSNSAGTVFVTKLGVSTTGIENSPYNSTVQLFPNPSSHSVTLQTDEVLKNATLTVHNALGQVVKEVMNVTGQTVILSLNDIANGHYFVQLREENKVYTNKLTVIRK